MGPDARLIEGFCKSQRIVGMSPMTIRRRKQTLSQYVREVGPLADATIDDIESWIGEREKPATRQALLGDLRKFYQWAVDRGHLDHDPTAGLGNVKVGKRIPRPVPDDLLRLAIDEARPKLRATIMLGAYAGLRVSEIAALRWEDVDFEHGKLFVRGGKGDKDRSVDLNPELAERLKRLRRRPDGYVIGTKGATVSSVIRRHFARLGINYRPHDLRAAFATAMIAASNGNVILVARQMGHASVSTTQRYLAWVPDGAEVVAKIHQPVRAAIA